jgi:hypothetical protein
VAPAIAFGIGFTVTSRVVLHPVISVYVMVALPVAAPVTTPDIGSTVAIKLLLVHVPPPTSDRVVVSPRQTLAVPVMGVGSGFTSTCIMVVSDKVPSFILTLNESFPE